MRNAIVLSTVIMLTGCAEHSGYQPEQFIVPDKTAVSAMPTPKVAATFGVGNDPKVEKAYQSFIKNGTLSTIHSKGFDTYAYDSRTRPLVSCSPMHLCVVQLEQGEKINDIQLGDAANWSVNISLVGTPQQGSFQVAIKPKVINLATDMVVTTTKRTYNIGLVSQAGDNTHVINFYYPEDTLSQQISQAKGLASSAGEGVSDATAISVNHMNFNYALEGRNYAWRPVRVFDDGDKTFIQMPPMAERVDLPALYIRDSSQELQLVNYRYQQPYYVVDGLFKTAVLISGKGGDQQAVQINNRNFG